MKASETTLRELLEGTKQFQIPLFQRRYSWNKTYWLTLWEDLINIYDGGVEGGYFVGTVVTQSTPGTAHGITPFIVIDGQQRLTTFTLLLAVVRNLFKLSEDENSADEINQNYLINKFKKDDDFYKLLPTQRDRSIYKEIIDATNNNDTINKDDVESSNIMQAFNFFTKQLNSAIKNNEVELDKLKYVILDRLLLVSITSDDRDNPYLIFESLNNKGLELTQSDLIRNYIFMNLPQSEREGIYKNSWLPLEKKFKDRNQGLGKELDGLTQFFWFYLRKNGNSIAEKEIYKQMRTEFDNSNDKHGKLNELIKFSAYYERMRFHDKETEIKLRKYFQAFWRLDFKTCNVFLLNIFEIYERSRISIDDFQEILCLLESYFIRRLFTGISTTSLSKIFDNLYEEMKLLPEDAGNAVIRKLRLTLKEYTGNKIFPVDEDFKRAVINQKIYKPAKIDRIKFIFERLEEHMVNQTKEEFTIKSSNLTVEHLMPQKLSRAWEKDLGEEHAIFHEKWLHTLANLTLTADNSSLSNKIFIEKKKLYQESKLNLNVYFDNLQVWNTDNLEERANILADIAVKIWPMP